MTKLAKINKIAILKSLKEFGEQFMIINSYGKERNRGINKLVQADSSSNYMARTIEHAPWGNYYWFFRGRPSGAYPLEQSRRVNVDAKKRIEPAILFRESGSWRNSNYVFSVYLSATEILAALSCLAYLNQKQVADILALVPDERRDELGKMLIKMLMNFGTFEHLDLVDNVQKSE